LKSVEKKEHNNNWGWRFIKGQGPRAGERVLDQYGSKWWRGKGLMRNPEGGGEESVKSRTGKGTLGRKKERRPVVLKRQKV